MDFSGNMFENDVKTYGIQTADNGLTTGNLFENDVKTYGIQTGSWDEVEHT